LVITKKVRIPFSLALHTFKYPEFKLVLTKFNVEFSYIFYLFKVYLTNLLASQIIERQIIIIIIIIIIKEVF
jgi:hypothetical protein